MITYFIFILADVSPQRLRSHLNYPKLISMCDLPVFRMLSGPDIWPRIFYIHLHFYLFRDYLIVIWASVDMNNRFRSDHFTRVEVSQIERGH